MTTRAHRDLRYLRTSNSLFAYAQALQPDINAARRLVHDVLLAAFANPLRLGETGDEGPSLERAVFAKFHQQPRAEFA